MSTRDNGPSWAGAGIASFAAIAPQRTDSDEECPEYGIGDHDCIEHEHETIVIDLDELHRTGSTRIKGFTHNLYGPESG